MFEKSYEALLLSISDLERMQDEFSVRFAVENLGSWDCCHFRYPDFVPILRDADLAFCLDVGHANLNSALDLFLDSKPEHVHLHDNHGVWDEHAALGSGDIDFSKVMMLDAVGIIECMEYEAVLESLEYLK
jgi:sugar phosphate isomerase/epimerase